MAYNREDVVLEDAVVFPFVYDAFEAFCLCRGKDVGVLQGAVVTF